MPILLLCQRSPGQLYIVTDYRVPRAGLRHSSFCVLSDAMVICLSPSPGHKPDQILMINNDSVAEVYKVQYNDMCIYNALCSPECHHTVHINPSFPIFDMYVYVQWNAVSEQWEKVWSVHV